MKTRFIIIFISFCFLSFSSLSSQITDKPREFSVYGSETSVKLDTLSIIPDSFEIYGPDSLKLNQAFYSLDAVNARLELRIPYFWQEEVIWGHYRVFPYHLGKPVSFKDTSIIHRPGLGEEIIHHRAPAKRKDESILDFEGLTSSGNITRGISMGNRQDMVLNSSMDLQLAGMLSEKLAIKAVISDQHIPFQPEGTTQHLQDFDKVYIQITGEQSDLIAGDFELKNPPGYFMNFNKKAQGARFSYTFEGDDSQVIGDGTLKVTGAAAIARGKYARNEFKGNEGNQGPYKLTGSQNELFIMVIAGSERVYIDGEPLTRGKEHDYIIDYNMAEITFTPNRPITKDSRILIEFEYADRNYTRSMFFVGTEYQKNNLNVNLNFFSEQDHKNQPLFMDLTDERRELLSQVGDSLHYAFDWNVDSTGFQHDQVMYMMTDSLGYDSVFVYSIDPEKAVYRVGYTYVGDGNGNYRQVSSNANGRVYQWIAPQNGIPQGTHEPIIRLAAPRQDQMLTLETNYQFSINTSAGIEWAMTNHDINLFSDLHSETNIGHGFKSYFDHSRQLKNFRDGQWKMNLNLNHELVQANFTPLERYRSVEFQRDWNLTGFKSKDSENVSEFVIGLTHPETGNIKYSFNSFVSGSRFTGIKNRLNSRLKKGKTKLNYTGSYLNTSGFLESSFYRHRANISRSLWNLTAGIESHIEDNRIFEDDDEHLKTPSFSFNEWMFYVNNPDTIKHHYKAYYKIRNDYLPAINQFEHATRADDYGLSYVFRPNVNHRINLNAVYRRLKVTNESIDDIQDEEVLMGRITNNSRFLDGFALNNAFYEISTGMERKREYMYVEVPPGQGVYVWNDYNENGIPELDEFEIAQFPEEANYIRVFLPTDEFVRTYSTALSNTLNIEPSRLWDDPEGLRKFISRFSNRFNIRIDRKTTGEQDWNNINPFITDVADTALISLNSLLRNTLHFNRTHPVYGIEWTIQDNRNKILLSNGFEHRTTRFTGMRLRWNITKQYSLNLQSNIGDRTNESEFLEQRTFAISYTETEPRLNFQYSNNMRISLFYGYETRKETLHSAGERSVVNRGGAEVRYNAPTRGTINVRLQLSNIDYPFDENTPLAFEMLQGLRAGNNGIWNITWQQNLTSYLQLNLSYNGRKSPDVPVVHTGNVQVRALF